MTLLEYMYHETFHEYEIAKSIIVRETIYDDNIKLDLVKSPE